MIPLFDSLTHPTVNGNFKDKKANFDLLVKDMHASNFKWACAVGLSNTGEYDHKLFIDKCKKYKSLIPIAGINPKQSLNNLKKEISYISDLGFKGIKIHPRISGINWDYKTLPSIFKFAKNKNLVVMLCTFFHSNLSAYPPSDPYFSLVNLLKTAQGIKVILIHGGDVDVLRYSELVRANSNLILDLSMTIMRYENSSIDLNIKHLFKNLDRKICIGTDHPEHSHKELRRRFSTLSKDISGEKAENIGYKNLSEVFGVN